MSSSPPSVPPEHNGKVLPQALARRRLVDHSLVAWLLENVSIVGISFLALFVKSRVPLPSYESRAFLPIFRNVILSGFVMIEGSITVQKALVDRVYAHVPYFSEAGRKQSQQSWRKTIWDWFSCNLIVHTITSGVVSGILMAEEKPLYLARLQRHQYRFRLHHFLVKLAGVRLVADVVFYVVHRILHSKRFYHLHKRHHEHAATSLSTNFHFSWPDLILEGFTPILMGIGVLEALQIRISGLEESLLATYFQWYEIGSHSGKPVPTVTLFPPLAPLYNWMLGNVDKRNIEFHDRHHLTRNCNYGISQWMDYLLGTVRLSEIRDRATTL